MKLFSLIPGISKMPFVLVAILMFFNSSCVQLKTSEMDAWIFYYFEGYQSGLFAAYSYDLHKWHPLADSLIAAEIGEWKVFRDPLVIKGDGKFHVVRTTIKGVRSWKEAEGRS